LTDLKDWKRLAANPETFGEQEKALWLKIEPILNELLDELKANGKIETIFIRRDMENLEVVLENHQKCVKNYNLLVDVGKDTQQATNFVQAIRPYGFDDYSTAQLIIQTGMLLAVLTTELFRISLLFHSKGLDSAVPLEGMLRQLERADCAPHAATKLRPYLDLEYRNSLAHGLAGTRNQQVILYKNAKLDILETMDLARFMIRGKTLSVLTQCLIATIAQRKRSGFFT
jgi:hypothetical protein